MSLGYLESYSLRKSIEVADHDRRVRVGMGLGQLAERETRLELEAAGNRKYRMEWQGIRQAHMQWLVNCRRKSLSGKTSEDRKNVSVRSYM